MTASPADSMCVYVLWALPGDGSEGPGLRIAEALSQHLSGPSMSRDGAGFSIPVRHRSRPWRMNGELPTFRPIDLSAADCTVVIAVYDDLMNGRQEWKEYLEQIYAAYRRRNQVDLLIPINLTTVQGAAPPWGMTQANRRADGFGTADAPAPNSLSETGLRRVILDVLSRMLDRARPRSADGQAKRVTIFLSHAKHDGAEAAKMLEQFGRLKPEANVPGIGLFYDVAHTLTGSNFDDQFLDTIKECVFLAIVTDAYHERPWCQWELLRAKQWQRPIVVWDRSLAGTARSFPYLGNVPVVRTPDTTANETPDEPVEKLLIQVLVEAVRMQVWENHARRRVTECNVNSLSKVAYFARPPELADIAYQCRVKPIDMIVYPDPPIGADERTLFTTVVPEVRLFSLGELTR